MPGAAIAFTNPGGIRSDIAKKPDGAVNYAEVFASQPFRNQLVTLTLTGAQIKTMLEQQWLDPARPRILQVSKGFSYAWDASKPFGDHVVAGSISLNGQAIEPARSYRITVNGFLAVGGDGFTALTAGTAPRIGVYDVDALYAYFQANSPVLPATLTGSCASIDPDPEPCFQRTDSGTPDRHPSYRSIADSASAPGLLA